MSLLDRSYLYNFERPAGAKGGLFDYQLGAVEHCVSHLVHDSCAVLGLDTGLGKTCTASEIMRRIGGKVLWICPGGLIRQTVDGLRVPPWGLEEGAVPKQVVKAETGKELLALSTKTFDVAVVNRALSGVDRLGRQNGWSLVVVDEAHQWTTRAIRFLKQQTAPVLLISACARDSHTMMESFRVHGTRRSNEWSKKYAEACFIVEKTERVLKCIGAAKPQLVSVTQELTSREEETYIENLIRESRYRSGGASARACTRVLLAIAKVLPSHAQKFVARASHEADRLPADCTVRDEVRAQCFQLGIPAPAAAVVEEKDPDAKRRRCTDETTAALSPSGSSGSSSSLDPAQIAQRKKTERTENDVCFCCGLNNVEFKLMYTMHVHALSNDKPIWACSKHAQKGFCSTLVRFPSASILERALRDHPVPPSIDVFTLTSAKTAAYRARLVKQFASYQGQRYKISVIARACKNGTCPPLFLRILNIGHGYFHRELVSYLAKPRILVTDQTVDVGFDLHRHLDGITTSHILCNVSDMQQLVGRLARISVDRIGTNDTIDVVTPIRTRTLDEFFAKHLNANSSIGEDEDLARQRERDVQRSKDRSLTAAVRDLLGDHPELLQFFERVYSSAICTGVA